MARTRLTHATASLRTAPRSFVPFVLTFTGLTAIIVGILAMHVWMGGHGSTTHHAATVTAISTPAESTATMTVAAADFTAVHTVEAPGHAHDGGVDSTMAGALAEVAAVHAAATNIALTTMSGATSDTAVDGGILAGCGGDCAEHSMLGMCVLAMIVAGIAWLLTPVGRALLTTVVRRGPPVLVWASRPAPAPSLTRLCISRT